MGEDLEPGSCWVRPVGTVRKEAVGMCREGIQGSLGASAAQMLKIAAQPTEQLPPAAIWLLLPHPHPPWPWDLGCSPAEHGGDGGWRATGCLEKWSNSEGTGAEAQAFGICSSGPSRSLHHRPLWPLQCISWLPTPIHSTCSCCLRAFALAIPPAWNQLSLTRTALSLLLPVDLHELPVAKTKYCKLSDLKQQKSMRSGFWSHESEIQVL